MEKIESKKTLLEEKLGHQEKIAADSAISMEDFEFVRSELFRIFKVNADPKLKAQVISKLVSRIEVGVNSVDIYYHMGKEHLSLDFEGKLPSNLLKSEKCRKSVTFGSNSLTNGAPGGT